VSRSVVEEEPGGERITVDLHGFALKNHGFLAAHNGTF
jgi:hypothetical protein